MSSALSHGVDAAAILAGGENRRFPLLKGFITTGGTTIIERSLALLRGLFREVLISTNTPEAYFHLGVPLVGDVLPSRGPMAGIFTSLINVEGDSVFVVACDMPFVTGDIVTLVCRRHAAAAAVRRVDATVPVFDGRPQPLCGVYGRSALPHLEEAILTGRTSMRRFLDEIETCFVDESEVRALDPGGRCFVNINTLEDYEAMAGQRA